MPVITARYVSTFYSSYRIHNFPLFRWFYPIYELKYKVSMQTKFFGCLTVCRTMRKLTHFWTSSTNPNKNFMWSTNISTFETNTVTKIKRNKTKKKQKLEQFQVGKENQIKMNQKLKLIFLLKFMLFEESSWFIAKIWFPMKKIRWKLILPIVG